MFFLHYINSKLSKENIFVFIQKAVIKSHLVNLCTLCVVSIAPFSTCLKCEMCIFRDLFFLFSSSDVGIKQNNDRCRQLKPTTFMVYELHFFRNPVVSVGPTMFYQF